MLYIYTLNPSENTSVHLPYILGPNPLHALWCIHLSLWVIHLIFSSSPATSLRLSFPIVTWRTEKSLTCLFIYPLKLPPHFSPFYLPPSPPHTSRTCPHLLNKHELNESSQHVNSLISAALTLLASPFFHFPLLLVHVTLCPYGSLPALLFAALALFLLSPSHWGCTFESWTQFCFVVVRTYTHLRNVPLLMAHLSPRGLPNPYL